MKFWAIPLLLITACQYQTQSYPMMGEIYTSAFEEGFVGCEWIPHKFKTHEPLNGHLKLNVRNCSADGFQPEYGYKKKFTLDQSNGLIMSSYPEDPRYPKASENTGPILKLHHLGTSEPSQFMTQFLSKDADENCVVEKNQTGRWQIGYKREYLKQLDYIILSQAEHNNLPDSLKWQVNYIVDGEGVFPMEVFNLPNCRLVDNKFQTGKVFRISGKIIFEYDQYLVERNKFFDPGSVEYIE